MNREILKLAIPNILSNLSVFLISAVDTALMGHQSALHLAAVGIAAMVFNLIYWNFGFLRMGTTGLSAQAYGENDQHKLTATLLRALLLSTLIAIMLMVLQKPILYVAAHTMNVEPSYYQMVVDYFDIRIIAAPATLALYVLFGWFFGVQNAIIPLILTLFINVINTALSYYLVVEMGQGIKGVAYGTLIAQYGGIILGFMFLYRFGNVLVRVTMAEIIDKSALVKFLHVNKDIFIRTAALTFAFAFFYAQSASVGEMALAVTVVLLQFLAWISLAIDGFAFAAESLTGKYFGAKNWSQFDRAIRYSFYWGWVFAALYAVIYYAGGEWLLGLYTNDAKLIAEAKPYLMWTTIMGFAGVAAFIWDGVFIGMTASRAMRDSILIALGVFLVLFYLIKPYGSLHLYWLVFILFLAARGVVQSIMYRKKGRELR